MRESLGVLLSLLLFTCTSTAIDNDYYSPNPFFDCARTCKADMCDLPGSREDLVCRCDGDCGMYGDCCENTPLCNVTETNAASLRLDGLLQCRSVHLDTRTKPDWMESFWMVSECPEGWLAGRSDQVLLYTVNNCTSGSRDLPPFTDIGSGLVYKNEYCAVCNEAGTVQQWGYRFECSSQLRNMIGSPDFVLTADILQQGCLTCGFQPPPSAPPPRACLHDSLVDDRCLGMEELQNETGVSIEEELYQQLVSQCLTGPIGPLAIGSLMATIHLVGPFGRIQYEQLPFRNQYCAICNGVNVNSLFLGGCVNPYVHRNNTNHCREKAATLRFTTRPTLTTSTTTPCTPPPDLPKNVTFECPIFLSVDVTVPEAIPAAPFSIFVDVNGDTIGVRVDTRTVNVTTSCPDRQVYDWVNRFCRNTLCSQVSSRGTSCNFNDTIPCDGAPIRLKESEFVILEDNKTLLFGGQVFDILGYNDDGLPAICTNFTQNGTSLENVTVVFYSYPQAFSIVTYIGCSLSVIGCTFVLLTYSIFRELQTLPGKILMNLAATILATCVFLLIGIPLFALSEKEQLCHTTAIFLHWLILCQFSWMSVMSFEVAWTLVRATHLKLAQAKAVQRNIFIAYMLVGWGLPTAVTGVSIAVNYTTDYIQYGEDGFCWIGHTESFYVVVLVPVALSLVLNGITFCVTSYLLFKAQRGEAKLQKQKSTSYFRIYLSVFSITGLTWVFGFVAILARDDLAWYLFIILTSTQGFTICVAFLFTQKVGSRYKEFFWPKISSLKISFKPVTQDTSMAIRYTKKGETISTVSNGVEAEPTPEKVSQKTQEETHDSQKTDREQETA